MRWKTRRRCDSRELRDHLRVQSASTRRPSRFSRSRAPSPALLSLQASRVELPPSTRLYKRHRRPCQPMQPQQLAAAATPWPGSKPVLPATASPRLRETSRITTSESATTARHGLHPAPSAGHDNDGPQVTASARSDSDAHVPRGLRHGDRTTSSTPVHSLRSHQQSPWRWRPADDKSRGWRSG